MGIHCEVREKNMNVVHYSQCCRNPNATARTIEQFFAKVSK